MDGELQHPTTRVIRSDLNPPSPRSPDALSSTKPKMRGLLHEISFFASLVTGPLLIAISNAGYRLGSAIYSFSVSTLFGVSALYHRPDWKPTIRRWLRRVDRSAILLLIAGTYTPMALAFPDIGWMRALFVIVWAGAALGIAFQFIPLNLPKPIVVIPYLLLGWMGVSLLPPAFRYVGPAAAVLLIAGGILYTLGAIAYARRSPNPKPGVFGYHEVFHALVVLAVVCHYSAIAVAVV